MERSISGMDIDRDFEIIRRLGEQAMTNTQLLVTREEEPETQGAKVIVRQLNALIIMTGVIKNKIEKIDAAIELINLRLEENLKALKIIGNITIVEMRSIKEEILQKDSLVANQIIENLNILNILGNMTKLEISILKEEILNSNTSIARIVDIIELYQKYPKRKTLEQKRLIYGGTK